MKKCSHCKKTLERTQFYKNRFTEDGLGWECRNCALDRSHQYAEENREKINEKRNKKYWENVIEERIKAKNYSKAVYSTEEGKKKASEYHSRNRKHILEMVKARASTLEGKAARRRRVHIRNAKIRNLPHDFSEDNWYYCKKYFKFRCVYCGKKKKLVQEHYIPVILNGGYTTLNIVPACKSCNGKKKTKHPNIWCSTEQIDGIRRYFESIKQVGTSVVSVLDDLV